MRDETCGKPIKGFVWWKSKMYTFITEDKLQCEIAKDINKNIVNHELKYED